MSANSRIITGWRVGVLAGATAAAAALGGASIPSSAAAATPHLTAVELNSGLADIVSSTGRKLEVEVDAYVAPKQPSANEADVTVTRETADGEEDHTWMFPIKAADLTATPTGKGALKVTTHELSPFGALSLTMTPKSAPTTQSCEGTPAATTTPVKLVGSFFFNTRSGATGNWGSLGSKSGSKSVTFHGKNIVTRVLGAGSCLNGTGDDDTALPCTSSLIWDSSTPTLDLNGVEMYGVDLVAASRIVKLHAPAGAMRADAVFGSIPAPAVTISPDPVIESAFDALLVATGHGATSTGSAILTSVSGATAQTAPCGAGSKTVDGTLWQNAIYHNGVNPFAMKTQVFGNIHVPNNSSAMLMKIDPTSTTPTPTPTPTPTETSPSESSPSPTSTPAVAHVASSSTRAAAIAAAKRYLHARVTQSLR